MARPTVIWQGKYTHVLNESTYRVVLDKEKVVVETYRVDSMGAPKWCWVEDEIALSILSKYILKTYEGVK